MVTDICITVEYVLQNKDNTFPCISKLLKEKCVYVIMCSNSESPEPLAFLRMARLALRSAKYNGNKTIHPEFNFNFYKHRGFIHSADYACYH